MKLGSGFKIVLATTTGFRGSLYSGGVKVRKFQLVSNVELYWKLSSSKMIGDQGWCMDDIRECMK